MDFSLADNAVHQLMDEIEKWDEAFVAKNEKRCREIITYVSQFVIERYERPSKRSYIEPAVAIDANGDEQAVWYRGSSPKHLEFQRVFLSRIGRELRSPTIYAIAGGNRTGKSVCVWAMCFCKFIRDYAKDGDVFWAIAPTVDKMRQDVHEWIWEYIPKSMFIDRTYTKELGFGLNPTVELRLPGKRGSCKLVFKTEEQGLAHFEATAVRGVAWTEARNESLLTSILMRVTDKSGFILIDYLPCEGWHQERLINDPSVHHLILGMQDNAHNLPPGTIARKIQELGHDADAIDLRVYGKPRAMMGVVIKSFKRDKHVIKPFIIPRSWPLFMAGDWGFKHVHSFPLCAVAPNNDIFVIDEEYRAGMSVEETVKALWSMVGRYRPMSHGQFQNADAMFNEMRKQLNLRRVDRRDDYHEWFDEPDHYLVEHCREQWGNALASSVMIDNQVFQEHGENAGMTLAMQFMEIGMPILPAVKGEMEWSIEKLRRRFFDDKMFIFDRCPYLIRDLSSWKFKEDDEGKATGSKDKYAEQFKDGCDSLRYLLQLNPRVEDDMVGVA